MFAVTKKRKKACELVVVFLGGCMGTAARDALSHAYPAAAGAFPLTTFAINLAGSLALGFLLESLLFLGKDEGWLKTARLGLGTGLCGGFTTYSAFIVETDRLISDGSWIGWSYALASVVLGIACAWLGIKLARSLFTLRPFPGRRDSRKGGMQ